MDLRSDYVIAQITRDDEICMDDHAFDKLENQGDTLLELQERGRAKNKEDELYSGDIRIPRRYGDAQ